MKKSEAIRVLGILLCEMHDSVDYYNKHGGAAPYLVNQVAALTYALKTLKAKRSK